MGNKLIVLLALLSLIASSLACAAFSTELGLSNLRMALDEKGESVTSTFAPTDVFYALADLANAPQGTQVRAKWIAVNAVDTEPNFEFNTQRLDVAEDGFTGTIYFELSYDYPWPLGQYRVDLYLNDVLTQSIEFSVQ